VRVWPDRTAAAAWLLAAAALAGCGTKHDDAEKQAAGGGAPRAAEALRPPAGGGPAIVFQHVARGDDYAHVALAAAGSARERRTITPLVCERVHFAANRGLCLVTVQGADDPGYKALVIDPALEVRRELSLPGVLSRARVSPDGRYGATTGFVVGHEYAHKQFSTDTELIDMAKGTRIANLEQFDVSRDGHAIRAVDRNFWGVTFERNSDRFYATMRTDGRSWLIEGSVSKRRARVLHPNVECPSLSPDGTRLAYKKRVDDSQAPWRLHVLDLRTMRETTLAETRSVDDQAEWLDDDTVLYGHEGAVWSVAADGSGAPRKLLADALSPAVLRERVAGS
jgi:hypothetical protein